MLKRAPIFVLAGVVTLGILSIVVSGKPAPTTGSWVVDTRHSDAQIITDGTTDYGKKKMDITLGFGRMNGRMNLDDADPTKSTVDFRIYPATSVTPPIEEDGRFKATWLANMANHTLVCFHSKQLVRTPDGRVQATGELAITRVDRNVEATPSEAYAGPVYGPPMVHRVAQQATFVFDLVPGDAKLQKDGGIVATTSTKIFREDFPQLVRAVVMTYWPTMVQEESCQPSRVSEAYSGPKCTGTFMEAPTLPQSPQQANVGEDFPGPSGFNSVVGERLTLVVHMQLRPSGSEERAAGGN
jgi:polyisoprenoid-binding protein YceI